jgi:hypothetical protein
MYICSLDKPSCLISPDFDEPLPENPFLDALDLTCEEGRGDLILRVYHFLSHEEDERIQMSINGRGGFWLPDNRPEVGHSWGHVLHNTYRLAPNRYPIHPPISHSRSEASQSYPSSSNTLPSITSITTTPPPSSPHPPSSSSICPHLSRLRPPYSYSRERHHEDNSFTHDHELIGSPLQLQTPDRLSSRGNTPISRPVSRLSCGPEEVSLHTFGPWSTHHQAGFIDLTADSSPLVMPPRPRKRRASSSHISDHPSATSPKRTKVEDQQANEEPEYVAEVDLRDVDDDKSLARVLEQQRIASIKAQQEQAEKPVSFSSLQCIICMEPMTNITVTHCGRPSD